MNRDVTQARVAAVVGMDDDPVRRNYEITQAYADISRAFRDALGFDEANWCTFATWASATAGDFIRGDQVPRFLLGRLADDEHFSARLAKALAEQDHTHPETAPEGVKRLVEQVALDVAREIAAGNLKVFRELAPVFVEMIDLYRGGRSPKAADVKKRMRAYLTAGPSTVDGQSRLATACELYAKAAATKDPTRRSQLVLHANALVGFHEQIRLQPAIEGGLMAPFELGIDEAIAIVAKVGLFAPVRTRIRESLRKLVRGRFRGELDRVRKIYRDALTEVYMTLAVPGRTIRLGADVKYPKGGLPSALRKESIIEHDLELALLLEGYGTLTNGEEDSGARDWTRITDRMHFILDLFRANQRVGYLFDEPLTAQERERLDQGHIPSLPQHLAS
jgi:hypothetical protein